MSTQPLDYATILADLEAKRAALDATIASLRAAMGAANVSDVRGLPTDLGGATQTVGVSITGNDIPDGAFFGKSLPEATRLLLEISKKKLTTREIAEGLRKGGVETTSSDFPGIVHAVLKRARKAPNSSIVRVGSHWGLKEWWPKGIVSSGAPAKPQKKRKKKPAKTGKTAEASGTAPAVPKTTPQPKNSRQSAPNATKQMEMLLRSEPKAEFSAEDMAANYSLHLRVAMMLLGKLIKEGRAEKTEAGKYRYPATRQAAVVQ